MAAIAVLGFFAQAPTAFAQDAHSNASQLLALRPGLPIRLASPSLGLSGDMSVLRTSRDTVVVVGGFGERVVPYGAITRLEVFEGHTARGGFAPGARIGAVVGVVNALLCAATCETSERNNALLFSVPLYGVIGGAIGMLFGGDSYRRLIPAR